MIKEMRILDSYEKIHISVNADTKINAVTTAFDIRDISPDKVMPRMVIYVFQSGKMVKFNHDYYALFVTDTIDDNGVITISGHWLQLPDYYDLPEPIVK